MSIAPTPARIHLPALADPPSTILEFLCVHFPHIAPEIWSARVAKGNIRTSEQETVTAATPYRPGITVLYFREVATETIVPFEETVIYEDERLLVADKPHFLPVTPAGNSVNECLLFRLQRRTGLMDLAPVHRLDRDTAGLVLFVKNQPHRAAYTQLFAEGQVERKYLAIARTTDPQEPGREWSVESRIEPEAGSFRMQIVPGSPNAKTSIKLMEIRNGLGKFELRPATGKKHQLRLHMLSLDFPILNDPFYPQLVRPHPGDFSRPLQLLASDLSWKDPITFQRLSFQTQLHLAF